MFSQIFAYKSKSKTFVIFKNDNREKWNRDGIRRKFEQGARKNKWKKSPKRKLLKEHQWKKLSMIQSKNLIN